MAKTMAELVVTSNQQTTASDSTLNNNLHLLKLLSQIKNGHLDIRGDNLTEKEADELIELIESNHASLTSLCYFKKSMEFGLSLRIAKALAKNTTLTSLYLLDKRDFTRQLPKALAESLKNNKTLQSLFLCAFWFDDQDAFVFSELLKENQTLKKISFNYINFDYVAIKALVDALHVNMSIESFTLCNWFALRTDMNSCKQSINSLLNFASDWQSNYGHLLNQYAVEKEVSLKRNKPAILLSSASVLTNSTDVSTAISTRASETAAATFRKY